MSLEKKHWQSLSEKIKEKKWKKRKETFLHQRN